MEVRTYPVKSPSILCAIIDNEWGITVTEQDLREPKAETVQRIYGAILADLLSLDVRTFERDGQLSLGDTENLVRARIKSLSWCSRSDEPSGIPL